MTQHNNEIEREELKPTQELFESLLGSFDQFGDYEFFNIEIPSDKEIGSEIYTKKEVIDCFLVGYANAHRQSLDIIDLFNVYDIYKDLKKTDHTQYLLYSMFNLRTSIINKNDNKLKITLESLNGNSVIIWN